MAKRFELGQVYKRYGRYYLAITPQRLLTRRGGRFNLVRPRAAYRLALEATVSDLCREWEVDIEAIDALSKRFFKLSREESRLLAESELRTRRQPIKVVRLCLPLGSDLRAS